MVSYFCVDSPDCKRRIHGHDAVLLIPSYIFAGSVDNDGSSLCGSVIYLQNDKVVQTAYGAFCSNYKKNFHSGFELSVFQSCDECGSNFVSDFSIFGHNL